MDRLHALYQHWSWLPHFRAIAETEHLGAAARMLRITPPALSRALGHLESVLGTKLFERHGRRLVINSEGRALLGALRTGMRGIDDAVSSISTGRQDLELKIAAPGPYVSATVLPALARARTKWPELRGQLVEMPASVLTSLTSGETDLCLHEHAVAGPEVVSDVIHELQKVVACTRSHAAARRRRLSVSDLAAFSFVAPPANDEGIRNDGWPVEVARTVGLTVGNMQLGLDAARTGAYVALLPRPIAIANHLVPLKIQGLSVATTSIYASRRRPLPTTRDAIDRIVRVLREELTRLDRR